MILFLEVLTKSNTNKKYFIILSESANFQRENMLWRVRYVNLS